MKIIDRIHKEIENKNPFYSFEYFPPRTNMGQQNLYIKMDKMSSLEPLFIDITWGAGGSTSELTLDICKNTQQFMCIETQMHLTCTNINEDLVRQTLEHAKEANIRNILALRGDPPHGQEWKASDSRFKYAIDLVRYIRDKYDDFFGISVAGYPEGHPDGNYEDDLQFLKQKVDAGADFIITQLFYDVDKFLNFVNDCRDLGITCPILPGILPILNYANFKRMVDFCNVHVPQKIWDDLQDIRDNDEKVAAYGVDLATEMCQKILDSGQYGLHFYTLNREDTSRKILQKLNLLENVSTRRELPWKSRIDTDERTRPIFWANAKKYYIERTSEWDHFPNGRWGDSSDPQFGDIKNYHLFGIRAGSSESKRKLWGEELNDMDDVRDVFVRFLKGEVKYIPWCDYKASETDNIATELVDMNQKGYLTINSQPRVNAMPSGHKEGWGGTGGYLYQKEYFEFFCSKEEFDRLDLSDPSLSYCAINMDNEVITNCADASFAVTWGVFPNKDIIQPTIVDYNSFLIWKKDAFNMWMKDWGDIYEVGSRSHQILKQIQSSFYLVFVVDNDFVEGDLIKKIGI